MPNVVYELLLGGILTTTLVPVFVSHLDKGDEESTDAVVTVAVAVLLALTVVAVLAAPLIVHLYTVRVPAADVDAIREEATTLARFFLPQILFYGITSLGIALLNSRRRFAAAAFAPVLNNVIVIAALVALPHVVNGDITLDSALGNRTVTLLLGLGTTAGIVAMTVGRVDRGGPFRHPHPIRASCGAIPPCARSPDCRDGRRLRDREPGRAAGRVDPRVAGRRRALRVPSRVHLLPAPPRSPRGHVHHDVRPRARRVRVQGRPRRLPRSAVARRAAHRSRDRARRHRLRGARATARVRAHRARRARRAAKPSSPARRSRGSPSASWGSASTSSCSAASTRGRTPADRSS